MARSSCRVPIRTGDAFPLQTPAAFAPPFCLSVCPAAVPPRRSGGSAGCLRLTLSRVLKGGKKWAFFVQMQCFEKGVMLPRCCAWVWGFSRKSWIVINSCHGHCTVLCSGNGGTDENQRRGSVVDFLEGLCNTHGSCSDSLFRVT